MNRSFYNIARTRRVWSGLAFVVVICGIARHAPAAAPCCAITAIDAGTATVNAKETTTGRTFSFKVTNANLLRSLKMGQPVYANFATRQASIDGIAPCCNIISTSSGTTAKPFGPIDSVTAGKQFGPIDGGTGTKPIEPCCSITGIDKSTGNVAAKETASGKSFSFKVTSTSLLNSLKIGQGVYANFTSGQVSVDGAAPCCSILSTSSGTPASQFGPIDGVTSGKRFGPIDSATSNNPVSPCCSITGINLQGATVTANATATGRTFSFKVTNAGLLNSLKIGQGVYANFATRQVSVDGLTPCCAITVQPH